MKSLAKPKKATWQARSSTGLWKIPTRAFVYFIALVILLVATAFTTGLTVNTTLLTVVNAFIVALTAYGSYEVTFRKLEH